jgi:tetratricopeptide (TPR) repeat protein
VPGYFRALASLARVRAALDDRAGAIAFYEQAINIIPDPSFVAALGDLYKAEGRDKEAESQYKLVEVIAKLNVYSRQEALFYADHNLNPQTAYSIAAQEYAVRKDIYGADAVAWTALKAGKLDEAKSAIAEALRLGTPDAKLWYHAGEIAQAAGDDNSAIRYFNLVSSVNPEFDPMQSAIMKKDLTKTVYRLPTSDSSSAVHH